jgi:hypothetical protein
MSAKIQINSLVCAAPDVAAIGDEAFGVWVRLVVLSAQGDHLNSWLPLPAYARASLPFLPFLPTNPVIRIQTRET